MIAGQLPSLEEIYDCSSDDLRQLVARLSLRPSNQPGGREAEAELDDYIENINIELEERKTLEFFQELCALDNPYLQKVTDFNSQFLKLAEQALAQKEPQSALTQQQQSRSTAVESRKQERLHSYQSIDNRDAVSVTSAASSSSGTALSESKQSEGQQAHSGTQTRKMGLGGNKSKTKNSMKDFILSTLNKGKADGCYVIKKGGPPKPQPGFTVNERGHLVSPSTLHPLSTKSIKSSSSSKPQPAPLASNKQLTEAPRQSEKELERRRVEVAEKLKGNKAEKKKEKHLNNKQLVEMIRQEQQKKQVKKSKVFEKQNKIDRAQCQSKVEEVWATEKGEQICEQIEVQQTVDGKSTQERFQEEQIKEQIQPEESLRREPAKEQAIQVKDLPPNAKGRVGQQSQPPHELGQLETRPSESLSIDILANNVTPTGLVAQTPLKEMPSLEKRAGGEADCGLRFQEERDELKQMQKEAQVFDQKIERMNFKKKEESFGVIVDLSPQSPDEIEPGQQSPEKDQAREAEKKRCYNQEYWIHIRQEAELKIRRFKEEKEIQESAKLRISRAIRASIADRGEPEGAEGNEATEEPLIQKELAREAGSVAEAGTGEDEFFEEKSKELTKMLKEHKRRVAPKRVPGTVVAPPKPLHVLPTFDYLEIYPTFNHIFSVMYTKSEHQALQEIPSLMRELINTFSSHVSHFKGKSSYFQPGIFLPFDSNNKLQVADPRQLLVHTEGTYVNLKKMVERMETFNSNLHGEFDGGDQRYYRVVKTKEEVYDIISTGFLRRKGWKELPRGCSLRSSWNLFWSWSKPDIDISKLLVWQRINHFPFNKNLSRKDLLYKNLDAFRKMLRVPFPFLPLTFNLPKEYTQFSMRFHEEELLNRDRNYWIMKPIGKSRGRGIRVVSSLAELNYIDNIVVQKYITNPLLLDGYKFDLRIYVLVTSFHPLEAFVYREGFARLSTEKFSLEPMMMKNAFVHLTNFAVNKNNQEAKQSAHFSGGSKISLKALKDRLANMDYSFKAIWAQVHQIIIKSLLGCSVSVPPFPAAFELFGYDVMIDTDSNCHLIEINSSPSLERDYLIDEIIKQSLIDDILDIVDPPEFDKEQLLDIMSERLAARGKVSPEEDLIAIARCLKYKKVRRLGEMPEQMGLFERVAPSQLSGDLEKLIKSRSGANNPRNID